MPRRCSVLALMPPLLVAGIVLLSTNGGDLVGVRSIRGTLLMDTSAMAAARCPHSKRMRATDSPAAAGNGTDGSQASSNAALPVTMLLSYPGSGNTVSARLLVVKRVSGERFRATRPLYVSPRAHFAVYV
jgi:hypothetical protein